MSIMKYKHKKSNLYYANALVSFRRTGHYNTEVLMMLGSIAKTARRKHIRLYDALSMAIGDLYEDNTRAMVMLIDAGIDD